MIKQSVSILLAASILVCPSICRGRSACAKENSCAAHACCHASEKATQAEPADSASLPREHDSHLPCKCSNCICRGAVIEHNAPLPVSDDRCVWFTPPVIIPTSPAAANPLHHSGPSVLLFHDGMNPGRALRCLVMSYLC